MPGDSTWVAVIIGLIAALIVIVLSLGLIGMIIAEKWELMDIVFLIVGIVVIVYMVAYGLAPALTTVC